MRTSIGLAMLVAFALVPQWAEGQNVTFGIRGGMSLSDFGGEDADPGEFGSRDRRFGFAAGAFARVPLTPMFAVQPEANFSMQGATYRSEGSGWEDEDKVRLNYLQFPVLVQAHFGEPTRPMPMVFAGPVVAINLSCKEERVENGSSRTDDCKDAVRSTDFGIALGAGVQLPQGFTLEGRYTHGLTKIVEAEAGSSPDLKNNVLALLVGITFPR